MYEGQVLRLIAQISTYLYQLLHENEDQLILLRGRVRPQYEGKKTTLNLMPIEAQWCQFYPCSNFNPATDKAYFFSD